MALTVTGQQVESVLRRALVAEGYVLQNPPRGKGETGADIIAKKKGCAIAIECIGFQEVPPLRSKQFYEAFFRAISRLDDGANRCVMALPSRFSQGMVRRARHYGQAWARIAKAFPELEIWLVDVKEGSYRATSWGEWLTSVAPRQGSWKPRQGTIGHLVMTLLRNDPDLVYEVARQRVLRVFPRSRFNPGHFAWYKWRVRQ